MKGLLLAAGCSALCALLVTALFAATRVRDRAAAMLRCWLATVPLLPAAHVLTPPDLGFLPAALVEPRAAVELGFALFVHAALFFGGWLQLYNLADRGFSLRILIDIDEAPAGALSAGEIAAGYGAGQGLGRMIDKRLEGMVETGLITRRAAGVRLTPRGSRAARVAGGLRAFLRLPADG